MSEAFDPRREIDRQVDVLRAATGVADLVVPADIAERLLANYSSELVQPTRARVPFVLVPSKSIATPSTLIAHVRLGKNAGFVSPDTADIDEFTPIDDVVVPDGDIYAICDVDRGDDTRNWTPDEAMASFEKDHRSPLTINEGLAFLLQFPASLEKNHCLQTPASRCGDRRVPGLWISKRAPKLGFCWAGNRHTWLGIASCASRLGTENRGTEN
ncbi:hypothetical protein IEU95_12345 [Hoyosella rhizosphaerae]|uniref:Uncharacterized protein n=1 Tax=Hoyosella rhizosphaerae TaxID=1755582 RepID=A0A916U9H2_9ACTN|nr:DUF5701 family protein [Hoyosella rhizosphaerae]MBN4927625.1 hypothetical protein [Hoyosella rhizosphaerae]GGC62976.1 hypothetical protein GCM10011410_14260 [Hoyosella rhizosphaerae]